MVPGEGIPEEEDGMRDTYCKARSTTPCRPDLIADRISSRSSCVDVPSYFDPPVTTLVSFVNKPSRCRTKVVAALCAAALAVWRGLSCRAELTGRRMTERLMDITC